MWHGAFIDVLRSAAELWRTIAVPLMLCCGPLLHAQEICDNGIDDDGNGLIDLNDPIGCPCALAPPVANLIINGSFEDSSCCPDGYADFNCTDGWSTYYVSATPDYFNCDFVPPSVPQPLPDGIGFAGMGALTDWSHSSSHYEFITNCLSSPLRTGFDHELTFHIAATRTRIFQQFPWMVPSTPLNMGPIDMVIYGFASCPTAPYVIIEPVFGIPEPAVYCPTEFGWTPLGSVTYNPTTSWEELTITFNATFDVAAIMFGPACPIPADYISYQTTWPYFFLDGFKLEPVVVGIDRSGHPCTNDLVLNVLNHLPATNTYQWYLNGVAIVGQTAGTLDATALGLGEGIYTIRAIDSAGNCSMANDTVAVLLPQPIVGATPTQGCAPLTVSFTNDTDPALSAQQTWNLGDGTTTTTPSVSHTYGSPGSYDVRLTVTSPNGCTNDSLFEGLIVVHAVPVVRFTADTLSGCVGMDVQFTNTSVVEGTPSCIWDFGDGSGSTECAPVHAYADPGSYDVSLTVTSGFGCTNDSSAVEMIRILPTPQPAMAFEPGSGCVPLAVSFINLTPGQNEQTAHWDLGNGSSSSELQPATSYTTAGSYSVSLTMTNELGCSATITLTDTITAHPLPLASFTLAPDTGCAPLTVNFLNTTPAAMLGSSRWIFGDGTTSDIDSPEHTYYAPGTYSIALSVTSPLGCIGDTVLPSAVTVRPSPTANFSHSPAPTDLYTTLIELRDRSSADVIAWSWSLPDATPASAQLPRFSAQFPLQTAGTYPVQLIVTNNFGCTDTLQRIIVIDGVFSLYVPNAFTPNADGDNDVFLPILRHHIEEDYRLFVFDRWGTEVFSSNSTTQGWDGTVVGEEPKTDIYAWRILVRSNVDGMRREYRGHVTLLR